MQKIFYLNRACRRAYLKSRTCRVLECRPGLLEIVVVEKLYGYGDTAVLDSRNDRFYQKRVDSGILDAVKLDDICAKLIKELGKLDLFFKIKSHILKGLLHSCVADYKLSHSL